jgi:hypothetical protein
MNDQDFLIAFESGALPHQGFPHAAHIRMAWLYLRRDGWEQGVQHIREGIRRFAESHGATRKYHETITVFWARLVQYAIAMSPDIADFEAFTAAYPHLFDTRIIERHYSRERLWSDNARAAWIEPDLEPLPEGMMH